MKRHPIAALVVLVGALVALGPGAEALDLESFEQRITERTLDNGLTVIICERPVAPVFSFFIHVDVGASQERYGITGMAHMFEHMAFKGTDTIGTTDYVAELKALEKVEEAYAEYNLMRLEGTSSEEELAAARTKWEAAMAAADAYVVSNEFTEIIDRNGGAGLNAFTSWDETGYFYSLPANRLELWAYLESERFLKPVMREFYKERAVVMEERRMRVESNPIGRLQEQFVAAAYIAHPYHHSVGGWMSDLQSFSATEAKAFYAEHYVPANITVTLVGDLDAEAALATVERYFGRLEKRPKPKPLATVEPRQEVERIVRMVDPSQAVYLEGYHRPAATHPDDPIYTAIYEVVSNGRLSRLYRSLVEEKQIAAEAGGQTGIPGSKYPNLFLFYGLPTPGNSNEAIAAAIHEELDRLKTEPVPDEELDRVKTRQKADFLRGLSSNQGLAMQLGMAHRLFGDWRELFRAVDRIDNVTAEDIMRVAKETFRAGNRTVGVIETEEAK